MNIKYGHIVFKIREAMKMALEEVPRRGGMYNWMFLFKGNMIPLHELRDGDLEKYDVIQVNLSPVDQVYVQELADKLKNSSTLLIGNNDYVCEAWGSWGTHPKTYKQIMDIPDAVFGTEPYQASQMRDDAYTIPHPHWIKMLKHVGNDEFDGKNDAAVLYHWWEGATYTQSAVLDRLRVSVPDLHTRLYGYTGQGDICKRWQKVMFDEHMPLMRYPEFIRSLMRNKFLYENCAYHTYGRTTVDTAALKIPSVGTDRVFSMRHCWPNMCTDPFDARKQLEIMKKIVAGGKWLDEQVELAYEKCEYFNYKNSKERYMTMIDETKKRVGK